MTLGRMRGKYEKPEGLAFAPEFISQKEEDLLLNFISSITFEKVIMHDQVAKREVKDYGYDYSFETRKIEPIEPVPEAFTWLRNRAAQFSELVPEDLAECLVSKYPKGATIGWHRDAYAFGSKIIGISLLSKAIMRFQKAEKDQRLVYELELPPRSIYVISGTARYSWQHSIPPTKEIRYSITFRTLKKPGKRPYNPNVDNEGKYN